MYKHDLVLDIPHELICHKIQPTKQPTMFTDLEW